MFQHLFGKSTANIMDTDFIYFSDYLNRILKHDQSMNADYNNHIVTLTKIQKIEIYDKLYRKPRMPRMKMLQQHNLTRLQQQQQRGKSNPNNRNPNSHELESNEILDKLQRNTAGAGTGNSARTRANSGNGTSASETPKPNAPPNPNPNPNPPPMASRPSRSAPSTRRPTFR